MGKTQPIFQQIAYNSLFLCKFANRKCIMTDELISLKENILIK